MKGDFSRVTFTEKNHYRRVLMQQGRVEIDADGNEQIAIGDHIAATTTTDVVGQSGYPVTAPPTGAAVGGFALGLNAAGTDLTIAPGRMYVDGLLVENDTPGATLLSQPDMPGAATAAAFGATQPGIYVVYLDVWERLITALDNPSIRESALGGPDTSVRTQVVWQAKLAYSGAVPAAGSPLPTCATVGEPWLAGAASTGTLAASSAAPGTDLPCILPPETGYQRLENQLYRVEIHEPGPDGTATFKWSRENGSVAALITGLPPSSGGASGTGFSVSVTSLSDDPSLGLQAGDWVELIDDNSELTLGHGTLYQVTVTPTDGHTVTITVGSTVPAIDLTLHPKLRRWDQGSAGGSQGITVTTSAAILLEGGVQVQFSAGTYQAGDYWLIPARTATSVQQGYVEWPVDTSSNAVPQPPAGIRHHYAQLGLVEFTAPGTFGGLGAAAAPTDCRLPFLPLTDLMPAQSLSPCTFVVQPGPGWEQPILTYFENAPVSDGKPAPLDAEICFPVGNFPVASPLVISNAGHIRISGAGWGTRLIAAPGDSSPESLLTFAGCLSVAVRDLYGETSLVTSAPGSAGRNHINGTLAFSNCGEVTVENVWLRCGSAISTRGAACITIASDVTHPNGTSGNVTTGARLCPCPGMPAARGGNAGGHPAHPPGAGHRRGQRDPGRPGHPPHHARHPSRRPCLPGRRPKLPDLPGAADPGGGAGPGGTPRPGGTPGPGGAAGSAGTRPGGSDDHDHARHACSPDIPRGAAGRGRHFNASRPRGAGKTREPSRSGHVAGHGWRNGKPGQSDPDVRGHQRP